MGLKFDDFFVRYNPKTDTNGTLSKKIMYDCFINRKIKQNKPCKIGLFGKSGEGKSWGSLRFQEILLESQDIDPVEFIKDTNVFIPLEYPHKINNLLGLNEGGFKANGLKKVNIVTVHEARELVKSSKWQSFINTAIADVNELSREIKRLIFIIVSQSIKDVSSDIRATFDFYIKAYRPHRKKTRLYINVLWVDDSDLAKPKLKKRRLAGCLVYPDGRYRRYSPKYFELERPRKETIEMFKKNDFEAKSKIIKSKLNKLMKEMAQDMDIENTKLDAIVEYHLKNPETLNTIGKRKGKNWKVNKDFAQMYDLNKIEIKEFESKILQKLTPKEE